MKTIPLLIALSSLSFSQVYAGTCYTNYCDAKINALYSHEDTNVRIGIDADMGAGKDRILNCTSTNDWITLQKSNPVQQEIYSLLLSSKIADKEVRFRITEGTTNCKLAYVQLR